MCYNKRALIVGITGQDGSFLARYLIDKGFKVYGCSRSNKFANPSMDILKLNGQVNFRIVDVLNKLNLREYIEWVKPDLIFNLSGVSSVALSFKEPRLTKETIIGPVKTVLNYIEKISM